MKKRTLLASGALGVASYVSLFVQNAMADSPWLPQFLNDLLTGDVLGTATNRVRVFFIILFGFLLITVILTIIQNLIKFSREEGQDIKEATKIIQKQLMVVGGAFVAIMGIAVVIVFFGSSMVNLQIHQTCIDSPDGVGCFACDKATEAGGDFERVCSYCNANFNKNEIFYISIDRSTDPDTIVYPKYGGSKADHSDGTEIKDYEMSCRAKRNDKDKLGKYSDSEIEEALESVKVPVFE